MNRLVYIYLFLFLLNLNSMEFKIGDSCLYNFKTRNFYDAELNIKVSSIDKNGGVELLITQRNGTLRTKKKVKISKKLTRNNLFDIFLDISKTNLKSDIKVNSKKIIDDYSFYYKGIKYNGYIIKAELEIKKKIYNVSYIFSDSFPLFGLFRFTITQEVNSKKKYKFKNIMLIKECLVNGKKIKL